MIKAKNAWFLFVVAGLMTACTVSYSSPSGSTGAASPSGLSSTSPALATMNALRTAFIQQTAQARGLTPGGEATNTSSFSTVAVTPSGTQSTPVSGTPTVATATVPVVPTSTPGHPATYKINEGETVYCLGRRFNISPNDILALNGLGANDNVFPGDVLKIPSNGGPFPGDRALHTHTANMVFTVSATYDTIYKIACYFGDVDPNRIIAANNLKDPYTLTSGQKLIIP
ncbi:MAG: LysM peptidoglycan-binding domain-containing protein [Anaerolineales bacterium]